MDLDTIIPGSVGLLIFGGGTAYLIVLRFLAWSSRKWPTVGGIVTQSRMRVADNNRHRAAATVRYTYEANGSAYTAGRVYFGHFLVQDRREAGRIVSRYGKGSSVSVRYHPQRPGISTLENKVPRFLDLWIVIGLFMAGTILYGLLTGT